MLERFRRIIDRMKAFGRRLQAAAVGAGLWGIYWLGLGAVRLFLMIFQRKLLHGPTTTTGSYWLPVRTSECELATFDHQS